MFETKCKADIANRPCFRVKMLIKIPNRLILKINVFPRWRVGDRSQHYIYNRLKNIFLRNFLHFEKILTH